MIFLKLCLIYFFVRCLTKCIIGTCVFFNDIKRLEDHLVVGKDYTLKLNVVVYWFELVVAAGAMYEFMKIGGW